MAVVSVKQMAVWTVAIGFLAVLVLGLGVPRPAHATFISSAGDPALAGATIYDFDSDPGDLFFTTRTFDTAFIFTADANELHIDDTFCAQFGTSGNCLDTIRVDEQAAASDDLGDRRAARCYNRRAAGHRFQRRQAEALVQRREDENLGEVVEGAQVLLGQEPERPHPVGDAEVGAQ